jgi:integrase
MSPLTVKALDRYLRLRARYPYAHAPQLWLTRRGPMTSNGILQMVYRRGEQAGLDHLHPHMFRHSFAQSWLRNGGDDLELMKLAGWESLAMVKRYTDATAAERARQAHKKFSPMEALRAHRTK